MSGGVVEGGGGCGCGDGFGFGGGGWHAAAYLFVTLAWSPRSY